MEARVEKLAIGTVCCVDLIMSGVDIIAHRQLNEEEKRAILKKLMESIQHMASSGGDIRAELGVEDIFRNPPPSLLEASIRG
mmetsp:Transcript_23654/g.35066  ORF Transcript_23654/g.35066 Transcript_23654/m.35066 type:complete len:82 (-) Transcript_23654:569-814(-)